MSSSARTRNSVRMTTLTLRLKSNLSMKARHIGAGRKSPSMPLMAMSVLSHTCLSRKNPDLLTSRLFIFHQAVRETCPQARTRGFLTLLILAYGVVVPFCIPSGNVGSGVGVGEPVECTPIIGSFWFDLEARRAYNHVTVDRSNVLTGGAIRPH